MSGLFSGTDRFKVVREIGHGGMGVVFEVVDAERGERVALKTLGSPDPDRLFRLKREFRALADLDSPHLIRLHELFVEDGLPFFTMELVRGRSLLAHLELDRGDGLTDPDSGVPPSGPSSASRTWSGGLQGGAFGGEPETELVWPVCHEGRLRATLPQLVQGLVDLHASGQVHRDIKPSNVMVTTEGRVVLLDFGLVAQVGELEGGHEGPVIGTVAYMAPEQCHGEVATPAADWYAVGCVLYQALSGRQPFTGTPTSVMLAKQSSTPMAPSAIVAGVPEDLERLCLDLLQVDPRRRAGGAEILGRLGSSRPDARGRWTPVAADQTRFTGRELELERLSAALAGVDAGGARTSLVCGPSGIGKTAVVSQFLDRESRVRDPVVLEGRCYERETVPFQAIDSLVDDLSRVWRGLPRDLARELVPAEASLLVRLFPVLARVPMVAAASRPVAFGDPHENRTRALAALRECLTSLARRRLLVLVLDDLQWSDRGTLDLLADLMRPPDPPPLHLVLSSRPSHRELLLRLVQEMDAGGEVIDLAALDPEESRALAAALLGERRELSARVAEEAGGSPYFIAELARATLNEGGAGVVPDTLDDLLTTRIQSLGEAARQVLEVVVLAGARLSRRALRRAVGLDRAEIARHIARLRALNLVHVAGRGEAERLEPAHDRIRDATLACLSQGARADHHRALALALEGRGGAEQLAYHWRGAGDPERATRHALDAAAEASERLDFDRSANLLRMALELGSLDRGRRREVVIAMAESLANAGRPAEAAAACDEAAQGAEPALALDLRRRAAELMVRGGHLKDGLAAIVRVLEDTGLELARSPARAVISLLARRAWLRLRGLGWRERSVADLPPRQLIRIDVCWSVATSLGVVDPIRGAEFQSRHVLMALAAGEALRVGRALVAETSYLSIQGSPRARATSRQAVAMAERLGDPFLQGLAATSAAFVHYYLDNRWRASLDELRRAEGLLRRHGGGWELDTTLLWTCFAKIYLGEVAELARLVPAFAREASRRGDLYMAVGVQTRANLVWLVQDDIDSALRQLDRAVEAWVPFEETFQLQHFFTLVAGCEIALYRGRPEEAAALIARQLRPLYRSQMMRVDLAHLEVLSLRVRVALALAAARDGSERARRVREAVRHISRIDRLRVPLARALVPLFRSAVAHLEGRREAVVSPLREARQRLVELETMLWASAASRRLGLELGGDEGAELVASAASWMAGQGVVNPDRLTAAMLPGWED